MEKKIVFQTIWLRSDSDRCICCDGKHIFGYHTTVKLQDWLSNQIRSVPEGATCEVTFKVVGEE